MLRLPGQESFVRTGDCLLSNGRILRLVRRFRPLSLDEQDGAEELLSLPVSVKAYQR
jgi:hypothetical protein